MASRDTAVEGGAARPGRRGLRLVAIGLAVVAAAMLLLWLRVTASVEVSVERIEGPDLGRPG